MLDPDNAFSDAPFLGDNLALDFINSEYVVEGKRHDTLIDDRSVASWLMRAGLLSDINDRQVPDGLLTEARELRDAAKIVVNAAINSVPVDLAVINRVLELGRPVRKLEWDGDLQQFRIAVYQNATSPSGLLWPIAEALINLVTSDKFEFVRQCEAHDCILWFHDLSKSHRRRWCSMTTCGNRMKVAAFRARKKPG
ncbi:CGNR zinc finger domain-containing protein [Erwinia sp. DT-104]|jgi:predicted RNA-binding Zn ribbon-like protein|uniref:CGNR zinc finger domain-containing protein n=1 Tax=unclassified Erwinia TaxID=2622719 RepID=UPI00263B9EFF|nr:ABATE domain-containing protein [Erwinia sp. PsM31]MDN4629282.1 ABATE domain-containing protein [Erwinia sp. PsM31]